MLWTDIKKCQTVNIPNTDMMNLILTTTQKYILIILFLFSQQLHQCYGYVSKLPESYAP